MTNEKKATLIALREHFMASKLNLIDAVTIMETDMLGTMASTVKDAKENIGDLTMVIFHLDESINKIEKVGHA